MAFEKGHKLAKGRIRGSKNKVTSEVRNAFQLLLENNLDRMQSDLDALESKDRIKLILDITSFVIPKLKAIEYTQDKNEVVQLSPEDRVKEIERLKKKLYDN